MHTLHSKLLLLSYFALRCYFFCYVWWILLHMTSTCFLSRWNKLKRLKHLSSNSIKTKENFFHISLFCIYASPKFRFFSKPHVPPNSLHPSSCPSLCLAWVGQSIVFFSLTLVPKWKKFNVEKLKNTIVKEMIFDNQNVFLKQNRH